jgi:alpha-mannosidase
VGEAVVVDDALVAEFGPHQIRSFAVTLAPRAGLPAPLRTEPVVLPFDRSVASFDAERSQVGFDEAGRSLPAEMLPREIAYGGVRFALGPAGLGRPNAVAARGQTIALPSGSFTRLYLLAASSAGDRRTTFRVGGHDIPETVQSWAGFIGQWDDRLWKQFGSTAPAGRWKDGVPMIYAGLVPGFIKRAPVAWFASHRHAPDGSNEPYSYSYLFALTFELPPGTASVTLPDDPAVRILAATVSDEPSAVTPAQPLYDVLGSSE